ncbi:MAG: lysoplasmalogenase [Bacteroidales bacterium]|nr:lysoplasmalogenase [Bacteroidales bacterium]
MKKILNVLFVFAALLFCYAVYTEDDLLRTITKPVPLIILLFILKPNSKYRKIILIGFIFSLAGDIFLMKVVDKFIFGLAAFLIAHVFYIIAFSNRFKSLKIISSVPFYVIAGILAYLFYPYLGNMSIPVLVYIFVIMTMVWRAYLQRKHNKFAIYAFAGAILFAISDSNIALTKFVQDYDYSKIITIILYWSAQFLIYKSTTKA